uniref:MBD domain-containing protein n=1 Tax=Strigamia maritima TaxID=126957 RepID=T1IGT1_STRMM
MFCDFEELKPMKLELGEGSSSITGRGTVELTVKVKNVVNIIALQRVYYVKGFKHNLISVGKIDCAKFHILIYNDLLKVYKSDSKVCSLRGKLDDGLYRMQGPVQFKPASSLGAKGDLNVKISGNGNTESSETSKLESHAISVNMWHQRFAHMYTKDGRESHYNPSVESSDDSDDDSSPNQPQLLTSVCPAPKAPQRRPNVQKIPPYVSSRRKPLPVSTTPLKPTSSKGFNRAPIPNKPGWERVEVQRQSGATKGKWDIYFHAPDCKIHLRSRPELRDYCEQALKILYNPDEFNWKPSEPLVDTISQVGDDVAQTKVQETDIDADSDPECYTVRVYLAEVVKEPATFEEAMASPEKYEKFDVFSITYEAQHYVFGNLSLAI